MIRICDDSEHMLYDKKALKTILGNGGNNK